MRILITGVSGMVGRNFLEHPSVKQFDILTPSSSELNLLDYNCTENYLDCHNPDMVIHLAGKVGGIHANITQPVQFLSENSIMGINIILASKKAGIKKFINLGSSCMYPKDAVNPLKEEMILKGELEPTNEGYALAKIVTAKMCGYINNQDYFYKTLIPCNLYGRWDKFDPKNSHMIAAVIKKIHEAKLQNQDNIEIWGDGSARREFMYAGNFADCLVHVINNFETVPQLMNVGLGYDYTVDEYYKIIAEIIGYEGKFIHNLSKPAGMRQKLVNNEKLKNWGWKARTNLREGLLKTYKFYLEQGF
ncbi:MAG: GDP-L-fucose synthase [bacterium]